MARLKQFNHPIFVLCEGEEDAALLRALRDSRGLNHLGVQIKPIADCVPDAKGGKDRFGDAIRALGAITGFDNVDKVVLVADNDEIPAESVAAICAQLEKQRSEKMLTSDWGKLSAAGKLGKGTPSIFLWTWPSLGVPGCLETLLWSEIQTASPLIAQCVLDAFQCSGAEAWPISKKHKAYVRCFISLACKKSPAATLATLWNQNATSGLIPLGGANLDPVEAFLAGL